MAYFNAIEVTSNEAEVLAQLRKIEPNVRQAVIRSVNDTALAVQNVEREKVRVDTGRGRDTIARFATGEMSQIVVPTQPYLITQEKGRSEVYPVVKKALWWPGLPHPIPMAKKVKADPFVRPAYEAGLLVFFTTMNNYVHEALTGV